LVCIKSAFRRLVENLKSRSNRKPPPSWLAKVEPRVPALLDALSGAMWSPPAGLSRLILIDESPPSIRSPRKRATQQIADLREQFHRALVKRIRLASRLRERRENSGR